MNTNELIVVELGHLQIHRGFFLLIYIIESNKTYQNGFKIMVKPILSKARTISNLLELQMQFWLIFSRAEIGAYF